MQADSSPTETPGKPKCIPGRLEFGSELTRREAWQGSIFFFFFEGDLEATDSLALETTLLAKDHDSQISAV